MSHSFESPNGTKFSCNSDFSGPLDIYRPDGATFEVDGADIVHLVLEHYIKPELVGIIQDLNITTALDFLIRVARRS